MFNSSSMKKCYGDIRASIDRSSTGCNSSCRFYGCHNWKRDDCGFFEWIDLKDDEVSNLRRRELTSRYSLMKG